MSLSRTPRWYTQQATDHRPVCPPLEPESLWQGPWGPIVWDGDTLWISVHDRVVALDATDEPLVLCGDDAVWVCGGGDVATLVDGPEPVLCLDGARPDRQLGARTRLLRERRRWSLASAQLPEGARRSQRLRALPLDAGLVWVDTDYLYRWVLDGPVEALGPMASDERFFVGPRGAVLVGMVDEGEMVWHRAAAPSRPLRELQLPLPDSELRWSADGIFVTAFVCGEDGEGTLQIDLRNGEPGAWRPGWMPASAHGVWRPGDGIRPL